MHTGMRERANERQDEGSGYRGKTQIAVYRDEQEMNAERAGEEGSLCVCMCESQRDEKGMRERERERDRGATETQLGPVRGPVNKYQRYANKVNRSIV